MYCRSMLYNGSEVIRDVEWVIFDEVHYINDSEVILNTQKIIILQIGHTKMAFQKAPSFMHKKNITYLISGVLRGSTVYNFGSPCPPLPPERCGMGGGTNHAA